MADQSWTLCICGDVEKVFAVLVGIVSYKDSNTYSNISCLSHASEQHCSSTKRSHIRQVAHSSRRAVAVFPGAVDAR